MEAAGVGSPPPSLPGQAATCNKRSPEVDARMLAELEEYRVPGEDIWAVPEKTHIGFLTSLLGV